MLQFLIKRFLGLIFVLFGVSFITFIMGHLAPGDPITALLGLHNTPAAHALLHKIPCAGVARPCSRLTSNSAIRRIRSLIIKPQRGYAQSGHETWRVEREVSVFA